MRKRLLYLAYRLMLAFGTPAVLLYLGFRVLKNRAYWRTLGQRFGRLPEQFRQPGPGAIWIHAVSVGEALIAGTLIRELKRECDVPVFVSVTTLAGYEVASRRLTPELAGVFYAPLDFARAVRRVLACLKPGVVVVLETEIWPNLYREAKRAGCGLVVVNGRISDRAFPKYRKWAWLFREVLDLPDAVLVQSEAMRTRYVALGAPAQTVRTIGNLKYDFEARAARVGSPVVRWIESGRGPLLIAASTTADEAADEDAAVLDAWSALDGWRVILAPRKPERFDVVARMIERRGLRFARRSAGELDGDARVLLLDSLGELAGLFAYGDVVFVGGTLTETGGHNFLEPAAAGRPVVVGPRLENFREIAEDFREAGGLIGIGSAAELASAVRIAAECADELGARARARAEAFRGAARRGAEEVLRWRDRSLYLGAPGLWRRLLLGPLAQLWVWGGRRRAAQELRRLERIETPVISVGNITMGGTGKTPMVLHLARRFRERGLEPVVLTRGYGRDPYRDIVVAPRGAPASVHDTGDEAQMALRCGQAGIAVGADRLRAAREAERLLNPDVFVADDAFTHLRLARDVNLVVIDALDPFGGGHVFPLGRLREPLQALGRADLFVITRCEQGRCLEAVENRLRQYQPAAPVFRAAVQPQGWVDLTGAPVTVPERVVAFCGLGNARSFWETLRDLGLRPLDEVSYGDHHRYPPRELKLLVAHARALSAGALVTTEKDVVNLPDETGQILAGLPVYWLKIGLKIGRDREFEASLKV